MKPTMSIRAIPTPRVSLATALTLALAVLGGCGGEQGPKTMRVWGKVTYDGKPLEEGTIDFVSTDGSSPAQGQIKDGQYDVAAASGPVAEKKYRVEISAMKAAGKALRNVMGDGEPTMQPMVNTIPPAYNVQSNLDATISADSSKNQFDFTLSKVGAPGPAPK